MSGGCFRVKIEISAQKQKNIFFIFAKNPDP